MAGIQFDFMARRGWLIGLVLATLGAVPARAAEEAVVIPPPALDAPAQSGAQTVVLAGGCFWGVQGVYQHVKGVKSAISGYAGGTRDSADYNLVSGGRTEHAESVEIVFDPAEVSLGTILQVYFSVAHDPTQLHRQRSDTGPQYRTAIVAAD